MRAVYLLILVLAGWLTGRAQSVPVASTAAGQTRVPPPEKSSPVRITRFASAPKIDGRLDDEAWPAAAVFRDFYQTQPGDNIAPSRPTEVRVGYDALNLFIAFRAWDEPDKVRATVAKRDAVTDDDGVRVLLDTFDDRRRAYYLLFNPLGVQQDGLYTEERGEDFSLDIVMESKGAIVEDGYVVEVAIPFKSLRYEAGAGKAWGLHLIRKIKRFNNETDSWMPHRRDEQGWLRQAGRITGLEDIDAERQLEIIPTITVSESGRRVRALPRAALTPDPPPSDRGRFVNGPLDSDPGVNIKFGITPSVTLDLALNPDFAQVEADQTVVTANQRFPIFFEEKRPFFLEGMDIFQTTLGAVNTRAIVDPDYAVKLTGRRGRDTFGMLLASDNAPGNFGEDERADPGLRPGIERFLDKNAHIGVLRIKRDVGRDGNLGLIATSYNFIERHNQLAGFDGRLRFDPQTIFNFQVLGTTSRRFFYDQVSGGNVYRTGNGFGYAASLQRAARNVSVNLTGSGRTRDYRADVGFTRRTNTNTAESLIRYSSDPDPQAALVSWNLTQYNSLQYDWRGRSQGWSSATYSTINFRRQSFVVFGFENIYERLFEEEFERFGGGRTATRAGAFFGDDSERSANNKKLLFGGGTVPNKKYSLRLNGNYNFGALDLDLGNGRRFPRVSPAALANPEARLDPGPGHALNLAGTFNYQPTDALRVSLDYTKSRLVRNDTGRTAFDADVYSLRATYQFTRFIYARARVDYASIESNFRGQFIFGWVPNPGTSLFVGYNDDLNRNGFSPFTGQFEPGFRRNRRTFFVKMSYLLRRSF